MNRLPAVLSTIAGALIALSLSLSPASAQASRTWVSGVGDDANPCSRTAPCKTFAGAIAKTATNGEINCLDPGGFGTLTITKSISIDCHEILGSVLNAGTAGITVAYDSFASTDTRKTVNLRNLNFQGFDSGTIGIQLTGNGAGTFINIEDCLINGNFGGSATGILDARSRGEMVIRNTTVRDNGANGISVPNTTGSHRSMISNTRVINSNNGIIAGSNSSMQLSHVVVSNNLTAGLVVNASGLMDVDSTVITHNGVGLQVNGTLRLSNSDVGFNTTGSTGTISSFTNNRFSNNGALGTITPIGSTTNPTGQQ
jgi:hypothetical protein